MKKRKTKNQMYCEQGRAVALEKREMWGARGTLLYGIKLKNTVFNSYQEVTIGIFETEQERDKWFLEWEWIIKTYQKNHLQNFNKTICTII
jgi:hypothetical protein